MFLIMIHGKNKANTFITLCWFLVICFCFFLFFCCFYSFVLSITHLFYPLFVLHWFLILVFCLYLHLCIVNSILHKNNKIHKCTRCFPTFCAFFFFALFSNQRCACGATFKMQHCIGYTTLSMPQIHDLLESLRSQYKGKHYHMLNKNCNKL